MKSWIFVVAALFSAAFCWFWLAETTATRTVAEKPAVAPIATNKEPSNAAATVLTEPLLQKSEAVVVNIGEYIDPLGDPNIGRYPSELVNIGDYLDPDGDPNLQREPGPVIEIGEYIDPEGDPNLGRDPGPVIDIGDFIDAQEYFFGSDDSENIGNLGEDIDPGEAINSF